MLDESFYKTMISYLLSLPNLVGAPFQGNPDYPAFFALFTSEPTNETLESVEATYAGYHRFQSQRNPYHWVFHDGPPAWVGNSNNITFPAATGGAGQVITHWAFLYWKSNEDVLKIVVGGAFENPVTVAIGQNILFPIDTLRVEWPI